MNNVLLNSLISMALVTVPAVFGLLATLIYQKIKLSKTLWDDRIAAIAVAWAEDKIGSGQGSVKLEEASDKLYELSKGKISEEDSKTLVRATYQKLYGGLKGLGKDLAPLPTTPLSGGAI